MEFLHTDTYFFKNVEAERKLNKEQSVERRMHINTIFVVLTALLSVLNKLEKLHKHRFLCARLFYFTFRIGFCILIEI